LDKMQDRLNQKDADLAAAAEQIKQLQQELTLTLTRLEVYQRLYDPKGA